MGNGGGSQGLVASAAAKLAAQKQAERDEAARRRTTAVESNRCQQQQIERLEIVENNNNTIVEDRSNIIINGTLTLSAGSPTRSAQLPAATDSRRASGQFRYMDLLPPDGSFPHRTQPVGEPGGSSSNNNSRQLGNNIGDIAVYMSEMTGFKWLRREIFTSELI